MGLNGAEQTQSEHFIDLGQLCSSQFPIASTHAVRNLAQRRKYFWSEPRNTTEMPTPRKRKGIINETRVVDSRNRSIILLRVFILWEAHNRLDIGMFSL